MDKLLDTLEQKSFNEARAYIDDIVKEAEKTKQMMIDEAGVKHEKRLQRYREEANNARKQEITRINMKEINETHRLQEQLIDAVIDDCKAYFMDLSFEGYMTVLLQILEKYRKEKERPRLIVCRKYVEGIRKEIGHDYQVIADPELESGFIFSFANYDVNFEMEQMFQYFHQEMRRRVLQLMFGDDADEDE